MKWLVAFITIVIVGAIWDGAFNQERLKTQVEVAVRDVRHQFNRLGRI